MQVQVLVATMNQTDHSLIERMNISTDAIVGNQCDYNSVEEFQVGENTIRYLNFAERGVGLNRNNALMRATGDICLIADDDMMYYDGYQDVVTRAFEKFRDADVIVFNLKGRDIGRDKIVKPHRVRWYNFLRYGTARIAFRLKKVRRAAIYFNQCFGGGTEFSHGEDNLFLAEGLKNGLKIYAVPDFIAELKDERPSTWNHGTNDKYLMDQGCLYKALSKRWWKLLCLQDVIRHFKNYELNPSKVYRMMIAGGKSFLDK